MSDIEVGVLRALKAYKIEKGLSAAAAEAWAAANLKVGVARFNAVRARHPRDDEGSAKAAFSDLKTWAQAQG